MGPGAAGTAGSPQRSGNQHNTGAQGRLGREQALRTHTGTPYKASWGWGWVKMPPRPLSAIPSYGALEDHNPAASPQGRAPRAQDACLGPFVSVALFRERELPLSASQVRRLRSLLQRLHEFPEANEAPEPVIPAAPPLCHPLPHPALTKPGIWQESRKAAASFSSCFWSRTSSWQDSGKRTPAGRRESKEV